MIYLPEKDVLQEFYHAYHMTPKNLQKDFINNAARQIIQFNLQNPQTEEE